MSPIPVVVIGRSPIMASIVKQILAPEYDVIHIILSETQGQTDLPLLLSTPLQIPPDSDDNLGSRNYSSTTRVAAISTGGGFTDEQFNLVKDKCKDIDHDVVWLRPDLDKIEGMPSMSDQQAFGTQIGIRMKKRLDELKVGKEGGEKSGVHYWV